MFGDLSRTSSTYILHHFSADAVESTVLPCHHSLAGNVHTSGNYLARHYPLDTQSINLMSVLWNAGALTC